MALIRKISSDQTDESLVLLYKKEEDMEALGELYSRYMDLVYGVCLKYFREPEKSKDAVINIFEELVSKLKKYEVDNFKGWLYRLATNHCLMDLRKAKTGLQYADTDVVYSGYYSHHEEDKDLFEKEMQFENMHSCMERLPADQKQAITLFYLREKCYKEIAEETGQEINKVRSYIQNGRRNLKNCMEQQALKKA